MRFNPWIYKSASVHANHYTQSVNYERDMDKFKIAC